MFKALDINENTVSATNAARGGKYFCQDCGREVLLKKGTLRKHHFAHSGENRACRYESDRDYKSAWHIRMQDFFPAENREVRFPDAERNEVHIADVFVPEEIIGGGFVFTGTVIEFQHSPISEEEFVSRTQFHLRSGRRIVWIFDESSSGERNDLGRFRMIGSLDPGDIPVYKWMYRPRRVLARGPDLRKIAPAYSVCVYAGERDDVLHRIVFADRDLETVAFSAAEIKMGSGMDLSQFFAYDEFWQNVDEGITKRSEITKQIARLKRMAAPGDIESLYRRRPRRGFRF